MTFKIGLTGSIGMGKSTTAQMFVDEGCALWDADAAVHRLYDKGGAAVGPISKVFPDAIVDGVVCREKLKELITEDELVLKTVEEIVHPLVTKDREAFLKDTDAEIVVLDIPLLFEKGCYDCVDAVVVVTVDPKKQAQRLAERARMTPEQLEKIMKLQAPDANKRRMADYVVQTDTLEHARNQVHNILKKIRKELDA